MTALFWKTCGGALIAGVLVLTLSRQERDLALLLAMGATVLVLTAAFVLLEPILEFLRRLEEMADMQSGVLNILMKITGIGITGEIAGMMLADSGSQSLAKGVQLLSAALMLSLSLPILETLLDLLQQILGEL